MIKAAIVFKKAVAEIKLGYFLITKFLLDSASAADQLVKNFIKSLSDSATVSDAERKEVGKNVNELASMSDVAVNSFGKQLSDTIQASDSGSLRGQGYCSFDYFAEDYVGYSQSF